ncbi:MAG: peptidoglycan-binding domain-containing protein [Bacillota bacterium]
MPSVSSAVGKDANGLDVYVIQGMLNSIGSYAGKIHGKYDGTTVQGVKYFQKKHGLPVTGAVDNKTFEYYLYLLKTEVLITIRW